MIRHSEFLSFGVTSGVEGEVKAEPQEAERLWPFMKVDAGGLSMAGRGAGTTGPGDDSPTVSRDDTDVDFMCFVMRVRSDVSGLS